MTKPVTKTAIAIRALHPAEMATRLAELADILVDAVEKGASVHFMAGLSHADAAAFWRDQLPGLARGEKQLLVADDGRRLVGTVLLMLALPPNAPHRAEIGKMLVHSSVRRHGLGRRLLSAAEDAAHKSGRTLLLLDTETGSAGDLLYRSCGWTAIGVVPGHAYKTDGRLGDTTIFYKQLHSPAEAAAR